MGLCCWIEYFQGMSTWSQIAVGVVCTLGGLAFFLKQKKAANLQRLKAEWSRAGKDVVVLHMFNRARDCPNPSPFPLKLETWLRIHDIKYVPEFEHFMSSKNKSPWVTFNGEEIADSQIIIERLTKELDLSKTTEELSPEQTTLSRTVRIMLEDHFYWCVIMDRYVYYNAEVWLSGKMGKIPLPKWVFKILIFLGAMGKLLKAAKAQGIGRHTRSEVEAMGMDDLRAVSTILGKKDYVCGSKGPTEVDCVLFGFMCQILYGSTDDCIYTALVKDELKNLVEHTERMKAKLWPDWEENCQR